MRVTQKSQITQYQQNLNHIQQSLTRTNLKIASGKAFLSPSEAPLQFADTQILSAQIQNNQRFQKNIEWGITFLDATELQLENFSSNLIKAIENLQTAITPTNYDKPKTFANQIRIILDDLINIANADYQGQFLFSGTKTTQSSIQQTPPQQNTLPFEIVEDPANSTPDNPEGLRVDFKGNFESRFIQTTASIQERINSIASDTFGENGTQVFDLLIQAYNILQYKDDGTERSQTDHLSIFDARKLQDIVDQLNDHLEILHAENARVGTVRNRLEAQREQILQETTRLKELRSLRSDADLAQEAMNYVQFQTSLNYTLQIGSELLRSTLFDFIR